MRMLSVSYLPEDYSSLSVYGAPGRIRTPDPLIRSQVLYPAELPVPLPRDVGQPSDRCKSECKTTR